jgi:hypothetical protein
MHFVRGLGFKSAPNLADGNPDSADPDAAEVYIYSHKGKWIHVETVHLIFDGKRNFM